MKHKTELRKGLAEVALDSPVAAGADILSSGKPAGKVHSVYGETALAYLRFDRAEALTANDHALKVVKRF